MALARKNRERMTNEAPTTTAAPIKNHPSGIGNSVRSPNPWAYAGQATKAVAPATNDRSTFSLVIRYLSRARYL